MVVDSTVADTAHAFSFDVISYNTYLHECSPAMVLLSGPNLDESQTLQFFDFRRTVNRCPSLIQLTPQSRSEASASTQSTLPRHEYQVRGTSYEDMVHLVPALAVSGDCT